MSNKTAHEVRMKGVALARAKTEGFAGIYFGNCTTLSTRVRCEVSLQHSTLTFCQEVFTNKNLI